MNDVIRPGVSKVKLYMVNYEINVHRHILNMVIDEK